MLAGDKDKVAVLKGVKSALQYAQTIGKEKTELDNPQIIKVLQKESKKRSEAAELYQKSGNFDRAKQETKEKQIIDAYLPQQLSEEEISKIVDEVLSVQDIEPVTNNMGLIIKNVRDKTGASADGALIARIVKEKIS